MLKRKWINRITTIVLMAIFAISMVGCLIACTNNNSKFIYAKDIKYLDKLIEDKAVYFEWIDTYDENKPTVVLFHGETNEQTFTPNLDVDVYTEAATFYDDTINASTIGWKAQGLKLTSDNKFYDTNSYWQNVAEYNILIFHCEKFFENSETESIIKKIYTKYNQTYYLNGDNVISKVEYSLGTIATALYYKEMLDANISNLEIRFIGYGVGANLASIVSYNITQGFLLNEINYKYIPKRLTLCDPFLETDQIEYEVQLLGDENITGDNIIDIENILISKLSKFDIAMEMILTEEVNTNSTTYAFEYPKDNQSFTQILNNVATLILSESYSTNDSFDKYFSISRVSFDWYYYSVIGSDDSFERQDSSEYPVGYPHTIKDVLMVTNSTTCNWGNNLTRPMLNNRALSNDLTDSSGERRGKTYSISAWTPTSYILSLKGTMFTQQKGTKNKEHDVHNNVCFDYTDYILTTFRSENYQVGNLNQTIFSGYVVLDANANDKIDAGDSYIGNSKFLVTIKRNNSDQVIKDNIEMSTDEYGYYKIVLNDTSDDSLKISTNGTNINNFSAYNNPLTIDLVFIVPNGYQAHSQVTTFDFYNLNTHNGFTLGTASFTITNYNVYSNQVKNCLITSK